MDEEEGGRMRGRKSVVCAVWSLCSFVVDAGLLIVSSRHRRHPHMRLADRQRGKQADRVK